MTECNHVWRDTQLPTPKQSADELMKSISDAGEKGWWLKGIEFDICKQLVSEGKVKWCGKCGHQAVIEKQERDEKHENQNTPRTA